MQNGNTAKHYLSQGRTPLGFRNKPQHLLTLLKQRCSNLSTGEMIVRVASKDVEILAETDASRHAQDARSREFASANDGDRRTAQEIFER
jgi:hypothetical protein